MTPLKYKTLLFTHIDRSPLEIADLLVDEFNRPHESEWGEKTSTYHFEFGEFNFKDAYVDTPCPCNEPLVAILWQPKNENNSTAMMVNRSDGLAFAVEMMANETNFRWLHIEIADHHSLEFPANRFYFYQGQNQRCITSTRDENEWVFIQSGTPLKFEDTSNYKGKPAPNHLTREMIIDYLKHLGVNIVDPNFWAPTEAIRLWQQRL